MLKKEWIAKNMILEEVINYTAKQAQVRTDKLENDLNRLKLRVFDNLLA